MSLLLLFRKAVAAIFPTVAAPPVRGTSVFIAPANDWVVTAQAEIEVLTPLEVLYLLASDELLFVVEKRRSTSGNL